MDVLRLERFFACKRKESDGIQNPFGAFFALKSRQIAGFLMDELKLKARPSCLIHGLWIPGIDTVIFDIVAHKLTVSKKVNLLVVPSDGGIDPIPRKPGPIPGIDWFWIPGIDLVIVDIISNILFTAEKINLSIIP